MKIREHESGMVILEPSVSEGLVLHEAVVQALSRDTDFANLAPEPSNGDFSDTVETLWSFCASTSKLPVTSVSVDTRDAALYAACLEAARFSFGEGGMCDDENLNYVAQDAAREIRKQLNDLEVDRTIDRLDIITPDYVPDWMQ